MTHRSWPRPSPAATRLLLGTLAAAGALLLSAPAPARSPEPPARLKPASLKVITADGRRQLLSQISPGRPVVVVVMKSPSCPVCLEQLARLARQRRALDKLGATVVGLVAYNGGKNLRQLANLKLGLPIVAMPPPHLARLGMASPTPGQALPGLLFLNSCGQLVEQRLGRAPGHPEDHLIFRLLRAIAAEPSRCGTLI